MNGLDNYNDSHVNILHAIISFKCITLPSDTHTSSCRMLTALWLSWVPRVKLCLSQPVSQVNGWSLQYIIKLASLNLPILLKKYKCSGWNCCQSILTCNHMKGKPSAWHWLAALGKWCISATVQGCWEHFLRRNTLGLGPVLPSKMTMTKWNHPSRWGEGIDGIQHGTF